MCKKITAEDIEIHILNNSHLQFFNIFRLKMSVIVLDLTVFKFRLSPWKLITQIHKFIEIKYVTPLLVLCRIKCWQVY